MKKELKIKLIEFAIVLVILAIAFLIGRYEASSFPNGVFGP
jgi:hypothetical protein